jgi:hypothetical protein
MKITNITNNDFLLEFSGFDELIQLQREIRKIDYTQRIALTCHFAAKKTIKQSIDFEMINDLFSESDISPKFKKLTELRDLLAVLNENPIVIQYFV